MRIGRRIMLWLRRRTLQWLRRRCKRRRLLKIFMSLFVAIQKMCDEEGLYGGYAAIEIIPGICEVSMPPAPAYETYMTHIQVDNMPSADNLLSWRIPTEKKHIIKESQLLKSPWLQPKKNQKEADVANGGPITSSVMEEEAEALKVEDKKGPSGARTKCNF